MLFEGTHQPDELDRQILFYLDRNARELTSQIARDLKRGRDTVDYRISRLVDRGVIQKFTAIIDPSRLGLQIFKTYLKLSGGNESRKKLVDLLHKHRSVYWIAESDGSWDLLFSLLVSDLAEFHKTQAEILDAFHHCVVEFDVYPLVSAYWFKKDYLFAGTPGFKISGVHPRIAASSEVVAIDEIDRAILRAVSENGRAPIAQLSKMLNVKADAVRYRLKKLEDNGVIVGYRSQLNLSKISMSMFKAQFFLSSPSLELEKTLFKYCADHPNITYFITQVGNCRFEAEIEVADYYQYNLVIENLRNRFADSIRNVETTLMRTDHYKWT